MIDKKKVIMDAAIQLFASSGFEGTSMRDLAASANVNLAMINYYFGSKEGLLEEILTYNASYLTTKLQDIANNIELNSLEKVYCVIDAILEKMYTNRQFHKLWHHEIMLNQRGHLSDKIQKIITNNSDTIYKVVEQGINNGEFRQVDIRLTVSTIFGTINHLFLSRTICQLVVNNTLDDSNPFTPELKERLSAHLKELISAHLLNK